MFEKMPRKTGSIKLVKERYVALKCLDCSLDKTYRMIMKTLLGVIRNCRVGSVEKWENSKNI